MKINVITMLEKYYVFFKYLQMTYLILKCIFIYIK
jgi:hypothetical protein